jgi:hypothetical protein
MENAAEPTGEMPGPGPVVCHRCGATWGEDRAFLPERARTRDGAWSWTCVACATDGDAGPR